MQSYFYSLADYLQTLLQGDEVYLAWLAAEESDFVRFNKSAVRQASSVSQLALTLTLIARQRRAEIRLMLAGDAALDKAQLKDALENLRRDLGDLPEDPFLLYATEVRSTDYQGASELPDPARVLDDVLAAAAGVDLVGLYAAGAIFKGFANSLGQRNWHRVDNFNFQWSLFHSTDKAVKTGYAGGRWDSAEFNARMAFARRQLVTLGEAPRELKPGEYRAFLAPSAVKEIVDMLAWGGFGAKSQRTKQSCLQKMIEDGAALNPAFSLQENTREGIASGFQQDGFLKSGAVPLISAGRLGEPLVSPRSAREYGLATNGANAYETPESLDLAAGSVGPDDVLATLGTGLFVGNLWYLNFSDRPACRMTGMTRFGTFWVENGQIAAPLNVMRFDDSAYRMLGTNLVALTAERDLMPDAASYGERSTASMRLPGAFIDDLALTL